MELDKISPFWFTDIGHKVVYESWEQYILCSDGLNRMWKQFQLFTWGCVKKGEDEYWIQILYVNPTSKPNYFGRIVDDSYISANYLERNAVEVKIKQKDFEQVKEWLIKNNPDSWGMTKLIG